MLTTASIEDTALERLDEWNRWMNYGPGVGPQNITCNLGRVQAQRVAAGSQGSPRELPRSVEEVEDIIRKMQSREKRIVWTYYEHTPMYIKARDCGLSYSGYWRTLRRLLRHVHSQLY
jgi:hypothetical protein